MAASLAYGGSQELKDYMLAEVVRHREADELRKAPTAKFAVENFAAARTAAQLNL